MVSTIKKYPGNYIFPLNADNINHINLSDIFNRMKMITCKDMTKAISKQIKESLARSEFFIKLNLILVGSLKVLND